MTKVTRTMENDHYGSEPKWDGISPEDDLYLVKALNWYSFCASIKDKKKWAVAFAKKHLGKENASVIASNDLPQFKNGHYYRMLDNGVTVERSMIEKRVEEDIDRLLSLGTKKKASTPKKTSPKPSVQDRIKNKADDILTKVESGLDTFDPNNSNGSDFSITSLFKTEEVSVPVAKIVTEELKRYASEVENAKNDETLREGYGHLKEVGLNRMIRFYTRLVKEATEYCGKKKTHRRKKVKPASELVKNLKYKKSDSELGLVSEKPEKLLDATEVWLYDTKNRDLAVIVVSKDKNTLTVRGSSIRNHDPEKSVHRKIRKPKEFFKALGNGKKRALKNLYNDLTTKEKKTRTLLKEHTIILRVW